MAYVHYLEIGFHINVAAAVADFDGQLWLSDGEYEIVEARERHGVAGAAANIQVLKVPSGTAKASGTNMLEDAGFSAAAVANTVVRKGPTATAADRKITAGDGVGIELSGASAALDGVAVTVVLKKLPEIPGK